jgi:outer membrane immunogenic protein
MRQYALRYFCVAAICGCSTSVLAADIKLPRLVPAPAATVPFKPTVFTWTGLYAGISAGYALGNADHYYDRQNGQNDHGQVWLDTSGFTVTGLVGYNYQIGNVVIGAEGELGFLGIDQQRIVIKDDDVLRQKTGLYGSIRGRIGYAFDRFLVYGTAGAAFVEIENAGGNPANAARFLTIKETRPGLVVGGGFEYAFTNHIIGRLEYLYLDTPEFELRNLENEMMRFDNNFHIIRAALTYKF